MHRNAPLLRPDSPLPLRRKGPGGGDPARGPDTSRRSLPLRAPLRRDRSWKQPLPMKQASPMNFVALRTRPGGACRRPGYRAAVLLCRSRISRPSITSLPNHSSRAWDGRVVTRSLQRPSAVPRRCVPPHQPHRTPTHKHNLSLNRRLSHPHPHPGPVLSET